MSSRSFQYPAASLHSIPIVTNGRKPLVSRSFYFSTYMCKCYIVRLLTADIKCELLPVVVKLSKRLRYNRTIASSYNKFAIAAFSCLSPCVNVIL